MPSNVAAPVPNAPHEGEENDHISANAFCNLSNLTVTEGAAVEVNNFGEELLPGQKGGSVHSTMFEGLKDSVIGGGSFTCGARVQYFTPSSGESSFRFDIFRVTFNNVWYSRRNSVRGNLTVQGMRETRVLRLVLIIVPISIRLW